MNVDYPYHFDSGGRTAATSDDDHVRDLIEQVLFTLPGERVNRPEFGCQVHDLMFAPNNQLTAAMDVGPSQVDGVTCEHYAFRQEGADWQLWIQQGPHPLPRKLIITTTTDPSRPQFASTMAWNLAPSYNDAAFTFVPPNDAKKIMLSERTAVESQ